MIQFLLKELMAKKEREGRLTDPDLKVTYNLIKEKTGISTNTLYRMANNKQEMVGLSVLSRLCEFFDCQVGDLMIYVPGGQVQN